MTQEEKSQQIKDIIINFSTSTKYTLDDAIDDIMALMEEYGTQRFKEGQQSIKDQLPSDETEIILEKSDWSLSKCFEELRFNKNHHLGLGDIRLTIAQQDEICELVKKYNKKQIKELPNDYEIIVQSRIHADKYEKQTTHHSIALVGFRRGAKWMKSKIGD